MTNFTIALNDFLNKNPDILSAYAKGIVNRRALAKYIIKKEGLGENLDAVNTALRRLELPKVGEGDLEIVKKVHITSKDGICIFCLEKNSDVLAKIGRIISLVNYGKNETLKIVEGSQSMKIFVDESKAGRIKDLLDKKDIIKIINGVAELNMVFPDSATKTRGIVAYITASLKTNNINMIEILSCTPELIIYVEERDLLRAYEALRMLRDRK